MNIEDMTFPISLEELLEIDTKDLWVFKFRHYCDKHHVGHNKLVSIATMTPGNSGLLRRVEERDEIKLKTMMKIESFLKRYRKGLPERI